MNGQLNLMKMHGIDNVRLDIRIMACSAVTYLSQKIEWLATRWTVVAESPDGAGIFVFVHTSREALWPTYRLHSGSRRLFPEKKNGPERVGDPQTDVVSGCRLHVSLPLRPICTFTKFAYAQGQLSVLVLNIKRPEIQILSYPLYFAVFCNSLL